MDKRFFVAIFVAIPWMLFAPWIFSEWNFGYWHTTPADVFGLFQDQEWQRGILIWVGCSFQGDLLTPLVFEFQFSFAHIYQSFVLDPVMFASMMAWVSAGILAGIVAGGAKRGLATSFLAFIIYFAVWLLFNVFAGEDLALIFSYYIIPTMGSILTGALFVLVGGAIGGWMGVNPNE